MSCAELLTTIDAAACLSVVAKRDLKSALRRVVVTWMGEELAAAPADPAWFRRRMAGWSGARFGISDASFAVVRSQLGRALRLVGQPEKRRRKREAILLGPAWQTLATALRRYWTEYRAASGLDYGQNWLDIRLSRFIRWCDANGILPNEVDDATIVSFIDAVAAMALRGSMPEKERGLRKAWNHCARSIAGWPAPEVATTRTLAATPIVSFAEDRFLARFIAGLDDYRDNRGLPQPADAEDDRMLNHLERMRRRALFHDRAPVGDAAPARRQRLRPLAHSSLYWHRRVLVMTATALVLRGVKRLEEIRSIADVACLDGAASVIDLYETRRNEAQAASPYPAQIVTALLSIIARCAIVLPASDRVALRELAAELGAMAKGNEDVISPKNRERLTQFDDPDNFALLVSCSEHEMNRLEAERRSIGRVTLAMARRAEGAIGNLILCSLPVRRRTLTTTDWARNFRAPTRRGGDATLVYHPDQSKTRRALQVVLEGWRWRLIELYWRHYRPLLAGAANSTFLFPGKTSTGHKTYGKLACAITQFVAKRTGLQINLHLWRHVMGAKLLEEHEDIRLVEELLGHVPGSRATRRYVELKMGWAAKRLDRITDGVRERGQHLHRRRERRYDRRSVAR